jgi:hypothetical protein
MMVYFTKIVVCLKVILAEIVECERIIVSPLVLREYLLTLGSLQMITERHIPLWLHSLLKHAAVSDDVLNIVTVMQGVVSLL